MSAQPVAHRFLAGKEVALTGRLASMSRPEAVVHLIESGATYTRRVTPQTRCLVVGLEGWPLRRDGYLTRNLVRAQQLQDSGQDLDILSEEEFVGHLGLGERQDGIHRLYTTDQLSRVLKVTPSILRGWVRSGLIRPVKQVHHLCFFDFGQVASAKVLSDLTRRGVTSGRIRRSLEHLGRWFPGAESSLAQLGILEQGGDLLIRLRSGQLAEPSGQLFLSFSEAEEHAPADLVEPTSPRPHLASDYFETAVQHEEAGQWSQAADAYQRALLRQGPEAEICFNLANVLYRLERKDAAIQRFYQAVELDPEYVEAWNNLGNVLAELAFAAQAVEAYQQALVVEPNYLDARYNLGETLEHLERFPAAIEQWHEYLRLDPHSPAAGQVRRRLEILELRVDRQD